MNQQLKSHWENIYSTKQPHEVSWTQEEPTISLTFIKSMHIPKDASIIDVGGGDSKLVDYLLSEGYSNISVLDISEAAIIRAKNRLGEQANKINWIVGDILDFKSNRKYDLWHDRAAFHFQTNATGIAKYVEVVKNLANDKVIIGTFSVDGPTKCSGLNIKQYDETSLKEQFKEAQFRNIESLFQYKNYLFATTYGEEGILRSSDNNIYYRHTNHVKPIAQKFTTQLKPILFN